MKIQKNMYDTLTEAACISILMAIAVFLIITWGDIPDKVPMQYDASGAVTRSGGKGEIIVLPIIAGFVYLMLTVVGRFPSVWNTGVKVTEENRDRVYRIIKNLLNTIKIALVLLFSYLTVVIAIPLEFSPALLTAILLVMFASIAFFISQLIKAK